MICSSSSNSCIYFYSGSVVPVNESPRRTVLRPETRVSELSELSDIQQNSRAPSPYTDLDSNYGCGDTASVCDHEGMWAGPTPSLERCMSCISKLGAMSRSSTATVTPGAPPSFSPWESACCHQDRASVFSHSSGSEGSVQSVWHTPKPPARPPKPGTLSPPAVGSPRKAPMPLPVPDLRTYDNYDIPKMPYLVEPKNHVLIPVDEHYDTPKRIKECLAETGTLKKSCGCILRLPEPELRPCPCQRVGCWPGTWAIPYCRRGNGTDTKGNCDAIYATVDMSKKSNRRDATESSCVCVQPNGRSSTTNSNYMNLDICGNPATSASNNYANIDFAQSLEYYENAKQLLQKAGITEAEIASMEAAEAATPTNGVKVCHKCGHANSNEPEAEPAKRDQDDYLMMEPSRTADSGNSKHPGYLPMSPAGTTNNTTNCNADLLKQRITKLMSGKSASNPNLGPAVDRTGKPSGSSMMHSSVNSPYLRRHLMDSTDSLELKNSMLMRKRSSSADSTRLLSGYEDDSSRTDSPSSETIRQQSSCCCKEATLGADKCPTDAAQIAVRRSSSVPCKSNRDSSSSNDSGVFELPRHANHAAQYQLATLPRRSKSSDPLKDLSFQFQKTPGKSSSAEAEVPICPLNSGSTSSGTSDMSDYIETLSLSSHSSSEAPQPTNTLRPRSGNEYLSLQLLERPRQIATVPEERFQAQ